jgi:hypothetical protein
MDVLCYFVPCCGDGGWNFSSFFLPRGNVHFVMTEEGKKTKRKKRGSWLVCWWWQVYLLPLTQLFHCHELNSAFFFSTTPPVKVNGSFHRKQDRSKWRRTLHSFFFSLLIYFAFLPFLSSSIMPYSMACLPHEEGISVVVVFQAHKEQRTKKKK